MKKWVFVILNLIASFAWAMELEYISDCSFDADLKISNYSVGGLSALQYDEKTGVLYSLSDFKWKSDPHLVLWKLPKSKKPCPELVSAHTFRDKNQKVDIDGEGLIRTTSGDYFVSSERSSGEENPAIMHFNSEGDLINTFSIPKAYMKGTETFTDLQKPIKAAYPDKPTLKVQKLPTKSSENSFIKWAKALYYLFFDTPQQQLNKKLEREYQEDLKKWDKEVKAIDEKFDLEMKTWEQSFQSVQTGFHHNSGFEAFAFDPQLQIVTAITEDPLFQDVKAGVSRILRMPLNEESLPKKFEEYYYKTDEGMRISETMDIGGGKLLILEIRYNFSENRVYAKLYSVNLSEQMAAEVKPLLNPNEIKILNKELVLDLNSIESKLTSGFHRLDNLEGMTFGPRLPSGERTLIMVSDNNNNRRQVTQFIFFKVKL
jgi:hypothetical protein